MPPSASTLCRPARGPSPLVLPVAPRRGAYRAAVGEAAGEAFYLQARANAADEASNEWQYRLEGDGPGEATGKRFTNLSEEARRELNELLRSAEFCSREAVLATVQAKPQDQQLELVMQTFTRAMLACLLGPELGRELEHKQLAARLLLHLGYDCYRPGAVPDPQGKEARNRAKVEERRQTGGVSSQYKGVSFLGKKGKWLAQVRFQGKRRTKTCWDEEEAARARDAIAREINVSAGANIKMNFPREGERSASPSSRYRCVSWHKGNKKYQVVVQHNHQQFSVGYFDEEEEAARAYDSFVAERRGADVKLNFPREWKWVGDDRTGEWRRE